MGYFERGLPGYWTSIFEKLEHPRAFIETGTFEGETTQSMIYCFDKLHTIEASQKYYEIAFKKLSSLNVVVHLGESPHILETLLPDLNGFFSVFFLDAHFSSGETYGDYLEQPLVKELQVILKYRNFTNTLILIDDARLLNGYLGYPSLSKVHELLEYEGIRTAIVDDILIIGSNQVMDILGNPNDFAQQLTSEPRWYTSTVGKGARFSLRLVSRWRRFKMDVNRK